MLGQEMLSSIQAAQAVHVLLDGGGGDVDHHRDPPSREARRVGGGDALDAGIVQTDAVEHSGGGLSDPRRRVAGARQGRGALGVDGAEALDVDQVLELEAVAEGAAGDADRVGQQQTAAEVDAQVESQLTRHARAAAHAAAPSRRR